MTNEELAAIVKEKCAPDYIFRQLAEECCELGQAALKMVRVMNGETPVRREAAFSKYLEELGDVITMSQLALEGLHHTEREEVFDTVDFKRQRMSDRLKKRV